MITSYLCGLGALSILIKIIKNKKLHFFGCYCLTAGIVLLIFQRG
jgi:undecaprenyl pyrophosphate phosphatase UppP